MFLQPSEIADLTGIKKKRPLQKQWLKDNHIPFTEKQTGELNVLRALVEQRHGIAAPSGRSTQPNYAALEAHGKANTDRTTTSR